MTILGPKNVFAAFQRVPLIFANFLAKNWGFQILKPPRRKMDLEDGWTKIWGQFQGESFIHLNTFRRIIPDLQKSSQCSYFTNSASDGVICRLCQNVCLKMSSNWDTQLLNKRIGNSIRELIHEMFGLKRFFSKKIDKLRLGLNSNKIVWVIRKLRAQKLFNHHYFWT